MSVSLFPPLPDELVDGHAGRVAAFHAGLLSSDARSSLIAQLADEVTPSKRELPQAWNMAVLSGMTRTDYARQHTLIPALRVAGHRKLHPLHGAMYAWVPRPWLYAPGTSSAHLCRECAQEDLSSRSYSWFRRIHNLPGIEMCLRHTCPLDRVCAPDAWCRLPHAWLDRGETTPCEINPRSTTEHRFQKRLKETYMFFLGREKPFDMPQLHDPMKRHAVAMWPDFSDEDSERFSFSALLSRAAPADWIRRNLRKLCEHTFSEDLMSLHGSLYSLLFAAMFDTAEEFSQFMEQVVRSSEAHSTQLGSDA